MLSEFKNYFDKIRFNRWVCLIIYSIALITGTCIYSNWQQYAFILLKGGVYRWKCDPNDLILNPDVPNLYTCSEMESSVNILLNIILGFELCFSIVAGLLMDNIGPRYCALIGEIFILGGFLMLLGLSEKFDMVVPHAIFTGIGINFVAYPALVLMDMFPKASSVIAAHVVGCQTFSSLVALIIFEGWLANPWWSFNGIWSVYIFAIMIPFQILYFLTLPGKKRTSEMKQMKKLEINDNEILMENTNMESEKVKKKFLDSAWIKELFKQINSIPLYTLLFWNAIIVIALSYWQMVLRQTFDINVLRFIGFFSPSQFAWGLLLGLLDNYIGAPLVGVIISFLSVIVFILTMLPSIPLQYLTAVVANILLSYIYTLKYTYIEQRFPEQYQFTLIGIVGTTGGLLLLICAYLERIKLYYIMYSIFIVLLTIGGLGFLYAHFEMKRYLKKNLHTKKVDKDQNQDTLEYQIQDLDNSPLLFSQVFN